MPDKDVLPVRPAVDYTNKDYASLRQAMLELAQYRVPEWTDRSPSDLGMLLVDLFAYMGDIILYYQDRIASESFLHTATERRSVLHLLRLIGYELKPPVSSTAELSLVFNAPGQGQPTKVTIPKGAQFATKPDTGDAAIPFEYLGEVLELDLNVSLTHSPLPVRHSTTVTVETLGSSTSEPNMRFRLAKKPLIPESLEVEVNEGVGFVKWDRLENLLYFVGADERITLAGPETRAYFVEYDEEDNAYVVFGDGVYGKRPAVGANSIRARYRWGGGVKGNVAGFTIVDAKTKIASLKSVSNPEPALGGADGESLEHAIKFGPLSFRSGKRAVTLNDYVSLAHEAGGVAKVRATSRGWNTVDLYVAPEGDTVAPAPQDLKQRLVAYFQDKRMVGTFVFIKDPRPAPIDIALEVIVEHNYNPELVKAAVEQALRNLLAFRNVDFGKTIYLSKVYESAEDIEGVHAVNVTLFRRRGLTRKEAAIPSHGRVQAREFEIPTLHTLTVKLTELVR